MQCSIMSSIPLFSIVNCHRRCLSLSQFYILVTSKRLRIQKLRKKRTIIHCRLWHSKLWPEVRRWNGGCQNQELLAIDMLSIVLLYNFQGFYIFPLFSAKPYAVITTQGKLNLAKGGLELPGLSGGTTNSICYVLSTAVMSSWLGFSPKSRGAPIRSISCGALCARAQNAWIGRSIAGISSALAKTSQALSGTHGHSFTKQCFSNIMLSNLNS